MKVYVTVNLNYASLSEELGNFVRKTRLWNGSKLYRLLNYWVCDVWTNLRNKAYRTDGTRNRNLTIRMSVPYDKVA